MPSEILATRKRIRDTVSDLASDFLYYDRKEDELLGVGDIERAIIRGEITVDEIVSVFRTAVQRAYLASSPTHPAVEAEESEP